MTHSTPQGSLPLSTPEGTNGGGEVETTGLPIVNGAKRDGPLPLYHPPTVQTFTAEELLAALGPAQAGSVGGQNIFGQ